MGVLCIIMYVSIHKCMYVCCILTFYVCMYVTSLGQEESARLTDIISGVAADYNRMVGSLSGDPTDFTPYTHQADHGKKKPKQKTMKAQSPAGGECMYVCNVMYTVCSIMLCMIVCFGMCVCMNVCM